MRSWCQATLVGVTVAWSAALAGPLLTPRVVFEPSPPTFPVNSRAYLEGLTVLPSGDVIVTANDSRRGGELSDISLVRWLSDGGLATATPLAVTSGQWFEVGSAVACLPSARCLVSYQQVLGPTIRAEAATLDLSAATPRSTVVSAPRGTYGSSVAASDTALVFVYSNAVTVSVEAFDGLGLSLGAPLEASTTPGNLANPVVASDGTTFLTAWVDTVSGHVFARLLSSAGAPVGASDLDVSGASLSSGGLDVAGSPGAGYCLVWSRDGASPAVTAARVSPSGVVLDVPAIPVDAPPAAAGAPTVAWDGAGWLLAWNRFDQSDRRLRRLEDGGFSAAATLAPPMPYGFRLARSPAGLLVAGTGAGPEVKTLDLDAGVLGAAWPRPAVEPTQKRLRATSGGGGVYVTWEDVRGLLSFRGGVVDGSGAVSTLPAAPPSYQNVAQVAFLGAEPVYLWSVGTKLRATRLSAPSTLLLDQTITTGAVSEEGAHAMSTPAGAVVATTVARPGGYDVVTGGLSVAGAALPVSVVATTTDKLVNADLAWGADAGLVVYRVRGTSRDELRYVFVDARGANAGPAPAQPLMSQGVYASGPHAVASSGTEFLVLWSVSVSSRNHELRAAVVHPFDVAAGSGGLVVASLPGYRSLGEAALAWDGREYLAAWTAALPDAGTLAIWSERLARDGTPTSAPLQVSDGPATAGNVAVAAPRPGEFVIAWSEAEPSPAGGTSARAGFKRLLWLPPGASCAAAAECEAGGCTLSRCDGDAGVGVGVDPDGGAGSPLDAGLGSELGDGGPTRTRRLSVGCDCSTAAPPTGLIGLWLLAAWLRRRAGSSGPRSAPWC